MSKKNLLVIIIAIVLIVIFAIILKNKGREVAETDDVSTDEEYVKIVEGGIKLNISSKLNETKTITGVNGVNITGIQLTEEGGVTKVIANATNTTNKATSEIMIKMCFLDKQGNVVTILHGCIQPLKAGQTAQLSASKTFDYANVYDIKVEKE